MFTSSVNLCVDKRSPSRGFDMTIVLLGGGPWGPSSGLQIHCHFRLSFRPSGFHLGELLPALDRLTLFRSLPAQRLEWHLERRLWHAWLGAAGHHRSVGRPFARSLKRWQTTRRVGSNTKGIPGLQFVVKHNWTVCGLFQLGWRPSLLGWRPSLLGWRPSLVGTPLPLSP